MKKLMLAIALVSFTAFSFAATPTSTTIPAAKQQTTQSAKSATTTQKTKKVTNKAAKKANAAAKTASDKK